MRRSSWFLGVLLGSTITTIGCSTTTPQDSGEQPPAAPAEPVAPAAEPELAPEPAPEPEPYSPDPAGFGDPCSDDAGCGWNDPCVPTRCIAAASARDAIACEESAPAPGACSCVAGRCSLEPKDTPAESPSCRLEPCGLDQGAGRCVAGSMVDANRQIRDVGPACSCAADSLECRFVWVEPIACETVADCWVSDGRPHYPVARPKALRKRTFEPCRDGEVAPTCAAGRCSLLAYGC